MSRIYFTSIDKEAELYGRERFLMDSISKTIGNGILYRDLHFSSRESRLKLLQSNDPYIHKIISHNGNISADDMETIITLCSVPSFTGEERIKIYDPSFDIFIVPFGWYYNQAIKYGSDIVRLATLIHCSCEIHGYFKRDNYEFICKIIKDGISDKIFRDDVGWDKVLDLFETCKGDEIVMSYSVTDSFPSSYVMDLSENEEELFYNLPYEEQFKMCFQVVKNKDMEIDKSSFDTIFKNW